MLLPGPMIFDFFFCVEKSQLSSFYFLQFLLQLRFQLNKSSFSHFKTIATGTKLKKLHFVLISGFDLMLLSCCQNLASASAKCRFRGLFAAGCSSLQMNYFENLKHSQVVQAISDIFWGQMKCKIVQHLVFASLCEMCPNTEFFLVRIFPHSD